MKQSITVLGAGSWGTALAILLAKNVHDVLLWGRNKEKIAAMKSAGENTFFLPDITFPENLSVSSDLQQAVLQNDELLVVVPSHAFRDTLLQVNAIKPKIQSISWATKGLEPDTHQLLHQIVDEVFPDLANKAVISGPTFATEVAVGLPTAVTIASNDITFAQHVSELLCNPTLRPYVSQDIIGLEIGGAAKNVMAIAAGIADGLGYGANTRSALITRGLHEISRLSHKMGGDDHTMMGLSGLGDLLLTCTDNQSRNRRMGLAIGTGKSITQAKEEIKQVVEGVQAARQIYSLANELNIEMPIVEQVYRVLYQGLAPQKAVQNLLTREYKTE
ncbi:MAG: NAD(P)-dependent glycerol-3-phosphate dehydrogenase [gamma proteobacterium symbiont of Bathyaustriella thionipta]|nr:NAD(P)-dependent glycerol-3-phosphate dehydrogenase [gamma proteobacterium symbiont of Bathyaustriella thionipta]MCU7948819.1 NAD(P)-dependent glycerol-3-phosphate dehydrogenase [gamma proteobacterium symbiont of Bathyaustriella thionipta]MCU7954370.1 NAD(P)-dependent glycerol-3-phosphate dehydrogenase [gamma proteobacterium symbiont of Bathyaustriella thionipta]MCU7955277.1 NAD(P)-dependent glycerol-3-phosphate dehydrogenase [gamma proteobacterium symbiont of Bathyaustriella thionipta]